jgi:hypothetical protein
MLEARISIARALACTGLVASFGVERIMNVRRDAI